MAEPGKTVAAPYDKLRESKESVEEMVAKMLALKKHDGPQTKSHLGELITQVLLNFILLQQANRSILLEENRVKSESLHARAEVDYKHLQLQGLVYEKNQYVKAIKAFRDIKTRYPDIELLPEEDFFKDAPEDIRGSVTSNDNAHSLMLKRLNYELLQRKELCKLHDKLEGKKKALLETIANRKKFISGLPLQLKALKKASLPVQDQLGVLHKKKFEQQKLAELLPPPLYVIYSQLLAQKDVFDEKIGLEITGSLKEGQAFADQLASKDLGIPTNLDNLKLDEDVTDEEDDVPRLRMRLKKGPNRNNIDRAGIYQSHPLKVTLHINDDETSGSNTTRLMTLIFEYIVKLNVICVGVEDSEADANILCNLFPDDNGLDLPHQSAKLHVSDSLSLDERGSARPYKWAQLLGGISFLPEAAPMLRVLEASNNQSAKHAAPLSVFPIYRQHNTVQTVVQKIRARKKAQMALA